MNPQNPRTHRKPHRKTQKKRTALFIMSCFLTMIFCFTCLFVYHIVTQEEADDEAILTAHIDLPEPSPIATPPPTPPPTPTPTPEPTPPPPPPPPWETFAPHSLPETAPEAFSRFSFINAVDESMSLEPISFELPENYTNVRGVTTFRGNNFRNNPTWGTVNVTEEKIESRYEVRMGTLGKWTGAGWTGQPVIIQWDDDIREMMNLHPNMREKEGLVEVIQGSMDGYIYFFELTTGQETRPRIHFGDVIKGGVTVDARGYPLLYVGQGDIVGTNRFGYYIFSLIDGSELFFLNGRERFASRQWGAFDGNPLFTSDDRLILGGENNVLYSMVLNTDFDRAAGTISIEPVISRYMHAGSRRTGIENSVAAFGHYVFFADNAGIIQCVDLHTLEPVWVFDAGDDTDASLVLEWEEEHERLVLYTGSQVDLAGRAANSYIRKLDAVTGEVLWEQAIHCGFNADVNGGVLATPLSGRHDIADLVIFSIARTIGRGGSGMVIAFCKETGEEIWEFPMSFGWSSPVAVYNEDGTSYVIVSDSGGRMFMLRGTTGEELSRLNLGGNVEASPAVFDNMLVVATRGQRVFGVEVK